MSLARLLASLRRRIWTRPTESRSAAGTHTDPDAWSEQALDLLRQSGHRNDPALIDRAVALLVDVLTATAPDNPDRAGDLSNLGNALLTRFQRTGHPADLDDAVALGRHAVDAAGARPERGMYLANLGSALLTRYRHRGDSEDLDESVVLARQAAATTGAGHPHHTGYLANLSSTLLTRYQRNGREEDLHEAITLVREAVGGTPKHDANHARYSANLGHALLLRFEREGRTTDIDDAVVAGRQALDDASPAGPDQTGYRSALSNTLLTRYEQTGRSADLDEAIALARHALDNTRPGHPRRGGYLTNLANTLLTRYQRAGVDADLDDAVALGQRANEAVPVGNPGYAGLLSNLGNALLVRYEQLGRTRDLDEAIRTARRAVDMTSPDDPNRAIRLMTAGNALHLRFGQFGASSDLDEAVTAGRQALRTIPAQHRAGCLSMLSAFLLSRSQHTTPPGGTPGDLDEAVSLARQAADRAPRNTPDQALYLNAVSVALHTRFDRDGVLADLDEAVVLANRAVRITPAGHHLHPAYLSNLGLLLLAHHRHTRVAAELDDAVTATRRASDATPMNHAHHASRLHNRSDALFARYRARGDVADLEAALSGWAEAAGSTAATSATRLAAARSLAEAVALVRGPAAAVDAYTTAMDLLPLVAWRGVDPMDRQRLLSLNAAALARDSAASAIAAGDPSLAVEWLEQGRGVFWSQLLEARTDLDTLARVAPEAAAEVRECLGVVNQPGRSTRSNADSTEEAAAYDRRVADARMRAAYRLDMLVARIRALPASPEFPHPDRFFRPPLAATLLPGHGCGPTVVVNVSRWRCDALIVTHAGVDLLPLAGATDVQVSAQADRYLRVLQEAELDPTSSPDPRLVEDEITTVLGWLWRHIAAPILDHLGYRTHAPTDWPRIWWCPTGALTLLPLHAAGEHGRPGASVYDRAVSSYTPTLRALVRARARPRSEHAAGLLVVAISHTPGQGSLPHVRKEEALLSERIPDRTALVERHATRAAILAALSRHRWFHASCHGTQNLTEPASGGLLPADWQEAGLVTVTDLTSPDHTGGEFAFLSACKTATGGVTNLDEAISITSAMQHAGWRHVIGTLWSVWDRSAAEVTDGVYPRLVRNGWLDPTDAAYALHATIRELRTNAAEFPSVWAPFVHVGP